MAYTFAGNFNFFLKVTQDLCLNHGGGSVREATYKHGVTSESMETDIIEKHSYSDMTVQTPRAYTWRTLQDSLFQNATLGSCESSCRSRGGSYRVLQNKCCISSSNAAPVPPTDSQACTGGAGKKVNFLAICHGAEEKLISKAIKISRFCHSISTCPGTQSNKWAHPLCSNQCAGFPWAMPGLRGFSTLPNTDAQLWWRMLREVPVPAPLPFLPSLAF